MPAELASLIDLRFVVALATVVVAALVRGFSGFGAAMIFVPVGGLLYEPKTAVVMQFVAGAVVSLPMMAPAVRICRWSEVAPLLIGATLAVPFGVQLLVATDPEALRWVISIVILALVAVLGSGWRYRARPSLPTTLAIGGVAGVAGGMSNLYGPPIVLFWLGGQSAAAVVRANLLVFLGLTTVVSAVAFWLADLFTREVLVRGVVMMPVYGVALWLGARSFGRASEGFYRWVALGLCAFAALAGLPVWERL